jgi:N-acetylglutamate synthase-like GNAT family acetyltransferase
MATAMTIRRASLEDATTLTQIALEASTSQGYPEHWIKHWESDLTISPEFIRDHDVYVAEDNGQIQGFYALAAAGLEHIWVTPELVGTGVGKELLLDAMERASENPI